MICAARKTRFCRGFLSISPIQISLSRRSEMKPWQILSRVRSLDTRCQRFLHSELRRILINAGLPMEFSMIAPIHRGLLQDPRVEFFFTSSVHSNNERHIFADAGDA